MSALLRGPYRAPLQGGYACESAAAADEQATWVGLLTSRGWLVAGCGLGLARLGFGWLLLGFGQNRIKIESSQNQIQNQIQDQAKILKDNSKIID